MSGQKGEPPSKDRAARSNHARGGVLNTWRARLSFMLAVLLGLGAMSSAWTMRAMSEAQRPWGAYVLERRQAFEMVRQDLDAPVDAAYVTGDPPDVVLDDHDFFIAQDVLTPVRLTPIVSSKTRWILADFRSQAALEAWAAGRRARLVRQYPTGLMLLENLDAVERSPSPGVGDDGAGP